MMMDHLLWSGFPMTVQRIQGDRQSSAVGQKDLWVVRGHANGSILWEKSFGGESSVGWESRILGLSDGSYVLSTNIQWGVAGDVSEPSKGGAEADYVWIIKLTEMETRFGREDTGEK